MTKATRLLAVLSLLFGCHGCGSVDSADSVDTAPGPADAFVGVWRGTEIWTSSSDALGDQDSTTVVEETISRVNHAAVRVESDDGGPAGIFDIGEDGVGHERPAGYVLTLKGDVLTMEINWSDGGTYQRTDYSDTLTLKRVP